MPGDRVEIKPQANEYVVYVNEKVLYSIEKSDINHAGGGTGSNWYYEERYLTYLENLNREKEPEDQKNYIELGKDEYLLMGDNWGGTTDCLRHGPAKRSEIVGKVEPDLIVPYGESTLEYMLRFIGKKLFG